MKRNAISISKDDKVIPVTHHENIISAEKRSLISQRYKRITKAVNREFWNSESDSSHSLYVGSYGRGTAIDTSDLDVLIALPKAEYERYDNCKGNGQSRLLQAVRESLLKTYPTTEIHADGQIIAIAFADDIQFEILPAFEDTDWLGIETYSYPDTNMGGNWRSTNPRAEQHAMKDRDNLSSGLLFDTCKHIRSVHFNYFKSYHLSGIVIDSFVYSAIGNWRWSDGDSSSSAGSYEKTLLDNYSQQSADGCWAFRLEAPGSRQPVETKESLACLGKVLEKMSLA